MSTSIAACFVDEWIQCHPWDVQVELKFQPISCKAMMSRGWDVPQYRNSSWTKFFEAFQVFFEAFQVMHRMPGVVCGVRDFSLSCECRR